VGLQARDQQATPRHTPISHRVPACLAEETLLSFKQCTLQALNACRDACQARMQTPPMPVHASDLIPADGPSAGAANPAARPLMFSSATARAGRDGLPALAPVPRAAALFNPVTARRLLLAAPDDPAVTAATLRCGTGGRFFLSGLRRTMSARRMAGDGGGLPAAAARLPTAGSASTGCCDCLRARDPG
jgi:hypothetical protein